jgi:hypothetical protein
MVRRIIVHQTKRELRSHLYLNFRADLGFSQWENMI